MANGTPLNKMMSSALLGTEPFLITSKGKKRVKTLPSLLHLSFASLFATSCVMDYGNNMSHASIVCHVTVSGEKKLSQHARLSYQKHIRIHGRSWKVYFLQMRGLVWTRSRTCVSAAARLHTLTHTYTHTHTSPPPPSSFRLIPSQTPRVAL